MYLLLTQGVVISVTHVMLDRVAMKRPMPIPPTAPMIAKK